MVRHGLGSDPPLPLPGKYRDADEYIEALLSFVSQSDLLYTLCGGAHILDFLTCDPDHFTTILPQEWREWLVTVPIPDLLDLLMREDLDPIRTVIAVSPDTAKWRAYPSPPLSFVDYVATIRDLSMDRAFAPRSDALPDRLSRSLAVGMKPKKIHEVVNFAALVDTLLTDVSAHFGRELTHVLDFGSGQNYLGRVLASPLYQRRVIAVESRPWNIDGASKMDVSAKLAEKMIVWRNKKVFKVTGYDNSEEIRREREIMALDAGVDANESQKSDLAAKNEEKQHFGRIQYVQHRITDGDLSKVFDQIPPSGNSSLGSSSPTRSTSEAREKCAPEVMVISLHSCGNLLHHGLRSLVLNPAVKAVAMIGCCYNLTTERLGPPTLKLPGLRPFNRRVEECASAYDPHGFPMSQTLIDYPHRGELGIRMNITARMMAVQAPQNWTTSTSDSFFTRHFYRALLQRMLVDRGFFGNPESSRQTSDSTPGDGSEPLTLGSLRKACYISFVTYVRGAVEKLRENPKWASQVDEKLGDIADDEILRYWDRYKHKKHELSIVWSLMAFSAGVVESLMVADRWLYLREQACVDKCWVQTAFEYGQSPRNLVVVGVKKQTE